MTGDDLCVTTRAIYFACWPVNVISRGQHDVVAFRHFSWSNLPRAWREAYAWYASIYLRSSVNRYNCTAVRYHRDAQRLPCMARPKTSWKPSVAHQCTALLTLFQITICCLWRQTTLIKDVFHSVIYTINRSLSGKQAKFEVCILHLQIAQSRNCTRVIIMQSWDSENAHCNLEIARNIITKLSLYYVIFLCVFDQ